MISSRPSLSLSTSTNPSKGIEYSPGGPEFFAHIYLAFIFNLMMAHITLWRFLSLSFLDFHSASLCHAECKFSHFAFSFVLFNESRCRAFIFGSLFDLFCQAICSCPKRFGTRYQIQSAACSIVLILPIDWVPELATDNGSVVSMAQVSVKMAKTPV